MECSCASIRRTVWKSRSHISSPFRVSTTAGFPLGLRAGVRHTVVQSVRIGEATAASEAEAKEKDVPIIGKDFLSDFLASLTGKENTIFFSDDRKLLQLEEVQELWEKCLSRSCTISQVSTALNNTFNVEAAYIRLPDHSCKLVGLGRIVSDGAFAALLEDLCVHPDYRKRGIGSQMLLRLESASRKQGSGTLGVFAHPREFMFLWKCGFRYHRKYSVMRYSGSAKAAPKLVRPNPRALERSI